MNRLWTAVLPELRALGPGERDAALRAARAAPLDTLELVGTVVAVVAVTAATRWGLDAAAVADAAVRTVLNFVVALPLLAIAFAPLHLRRLRRGLRARRGHGGAA